MKRPLQSLNLITCQLGNGASVCAIQRGKSIDTSMGFTPLEGLVMGTRSGSIDPAIPLLFCQHGMKPQKVHEILEKQSGLLALAGKSDVRDLLAAAAKGNKKASLALDIFAHHVRKYIGAYTAILSNVDAIVLGGGIAKSPIMRRKILHGLEGLGIALDARKISAKEPIKISKGPVTVYITQPDEERQMLAVARF